MPLCTSVYLYLVVTYWERAGLLALVCGSHCKFVTSPLVSWVRCGTSLYRFLIFAFLLTCVMIAGGPSKRGSSSIFYQEARKAGHYRPTSETPFKWRFAGGPIVIWQFAGVPIVARPYQFSSHFLPMLG